MNTSKGLLTKRTRQLVLLAFLLAQPLIGQARFVALVIGNETYPDAPLANPVNDAHAVAQAFESIGYDDVSLVIDAYTGAIDAALDQFSETAADAAVAISFGDMLVASSRIQTFKNDLLQRDWARLLDSRSLSAAARQNIGRWRSTSGDMNVLIENLRARESTQTVYADVVINGVDSQPDRITVQVVRKRDGNWSPINW